MTGTTAQNAPGRADGLLVREARVGATETFAPGSADASEPSGRLRVVVDLNRCQGYAQCCYAAPEAFTLRGHEILFYDPAPPVARRGAIERAVQVCPVRAIALQIGRDDPGEAP